MEGITLDQYFNKYGRYSHKCESCGKSYKMPGAVITPTREHICATCETDIGRKEYLDKLIKESL